MKRQHISNEKSAYRRQLYADDKRVSQELCWSRWTL